MLVPLRCFSYIPHADHSEEFFRPWLCFLDRREFSLSPRAGFRQDIRFCYTIVVTTTQKQSQILYLDQTKTQEQGLTGYSSVRLTSRASHRLGKCRLWWVWLGFGLLSALSECSACSGRGSHRHASSGFVFGTDWPDSSVLTWPRPYIFLFTFNVLFSEEFLLHSSSWF